MNTMPTSPCRPGVRWGTTTLEGDWITMEDVMTQCSMTYAETYVAEMTGAEIINMHQGCRGQPVDPDPYLQSGGDMVRVGGPTTPSTRPRSSVIASPTYNWTMVT